MHAGGGGSVVLLMLVCVCVCWGVGWAGGKRESESDRERGGSMRGVVEVAVDGRERDVHRGEDGDLTPNHSLIIVAQQSCTCSCPSPSPSLSPSPSPSSSLSLALAFALLLLLLSSSVSGPFSPSYSTFNHQIFDYECGGAIVRVERESDFETAVEYAISSGNQLDVSFRSRLEREMGWDREGVWSGVGGGE